MATNSSYDAPPQPLLEKVGWQIIRELIDVETAWLVYRLMNNQGPKYVSSLFGRLILDAVRQLCNTNTDLKLHPIKTPSGRDASVIEEHDFREQLILRVDVKNAQTLSQFKAAYKISKMSLRSLHHFSIFFSCFIHHCMQVIIEIHILLWMQDYLVVQYFVGQYINQYLAVYSALLKVNIK